MTSRSATVRVVIVLLVVGVVCVTLRTHSLPKRPIPPGDSAWRLTYTIGFHARKVGATIKVGYPETTRHSRVFEQPVVESGLERDRSRPSRAAGKRDITLRAVKTGQQEGRVYFDIHLSRRGGWHPDEADAKVTVDDQARYLANEKGIAADHTEVKETLERLRDVNSSRNLVERLFDYCVEDIAPGSDTGPQEAVEVLHKRMGTEVGRARTLVALCRAAKIPARLVTGFEIKVAANLLPRTWVEIRQGDRWIAYDPESGYAAGVPNNFVPVRREGLDIIRPSAEATDLTVKYAVARLPSAQGTADPGEHSAWNILDLHQLPVKLHEPIEILLLLPLGALATIFVRTIVGIRTFGTFTPTLLALAFVYCNIPTGLCVFISVMVLGFTTRSFLDRLKLLLVPRLGIILTLVVMLMVFSVSVLHYFHWTPPGQTVILPMVILTNLVERFYVTTEEDNIHFAVQLLATTVAMALFILLLLNSKPIGRMLLSYPELHCFTVVAMVLMGRYTGYRWTELMRFRDLVPSAGPEEK